MAEHSFREPKLKEALPISTHSFPDCTGHHLILTSQKEKEQETCGRFIWTKPEKRTYQVQVKLRHETIPNYKGGRET